MIPALLAALACLAVTAALVWWLLRLHRQLVLLAYAVHCARETGEGEAEAAERLARSLDGFPAGVLGRWMGLGDGV